MKADGNDYVNLRLERQGHVALLTLANPPANTWTLESLQSLSRLIGDLNADREIYALVITGEGRKFFSAGADLKLFAAGDPGLARQMAECFGHAFETLSAFRGVSVAAINGYAMGGGLECALACDIRIAEEQVQLALPEATVGLLPCAGGTQLLPWLVGEGWAKRIILCGERIDAPTARSIGLVEQVVPSGESLQHALKLAAQVARQSPGSVAACKSLIQLARSQAPQHNLPQERQAFIDLFATRDQKEGVTAFLEKRMPEWRNG
jgi:enoyl-CoA hydratase/carnithine racemase